jgi:hypothetical protein
MKKSISELNEMTLKCPVQPGELWRHYKGRLYKVLQLVIDCNTNEVVVIYEFMDDDFNITTFCRPLSEWTDEVAPGVLRFARVKHRSLLLTDAEYNQLRTEQKINKKEDANEGLGRMRKLLGRISRCFGY